MPKASKGTRRVPKTTAIILHIDGLEVPVAVRRANVKNLNLRVHPDGSVSASVPHRVPWQDIEAFVQRRAGWIARHVARAGGAPAADAPAPPRHPRRGELGATPAPHAWINDVKRPPARTRPRRRSSRDGGKSSTPPPVSHGRARSTTFAEPNSNTGSMRSTGAKPQAPSSAERGDGSRPWAFPPLPGPFAT